MTRILQSTARDLDAGTGCDECSTGRDALSGWGRLDVAAAVAALESPLPLRDAFEANDDAGPRAQPLSGDTRRIKATVDFWDDQDDVYAIRLEKGQPVYIGLTGPGSGVDISIAFWLPGARSINNARDLRFRAKVSARAGARQYLSFRARAAGSHFVQVRMSSPGSARYRLTVIKG